MSLWQQTRLLFIDFFNCLAQMQAPDGDLTLTCPLRRLPKTATIHTNQCPAKSYKIKER
jgi:hypothetical protein